MEYQEVRNDHPIVSRNQTRQHLFDFHGIGFVSKPKSIGKTANVRIDDDTLIHG